MRIEDGSVSVERKERWPATVSVGLILINLVDGHHEQLVMVRQRKTGKWTLVAGGVMNETWGKAARREFIEETGLDGRLLRIDDSEPMIKLVIRPTKLSVAIYPFCRLRKSLRGEGIATNSGETDLVKPFWPREVEELVEKGQIDRPEFNLFGILRFLDWEDMDPYKG